MKQFKEIETRTIVNENMKVETRTKTTLHTIRVWNELTTEEKEKEIDARKDSIYEWYQQDLYDIYLDNLENIKEEFKHINFENVFLDSNSQGCWIDKVYKFNVYYSIDIFGETLEVEDIDLHIRKYIDNINESDIYVCDYYIETEKMEKIQKSKKYKNWINSIIKEVNSFIDRVNVACKEIMDKEYYYPYNLENEEDKEFLECYFDNEEFETVEIIENIEV